MLKILPSRGFRFSSLSQFLLDIGQVLYQLGRVSSFRDSVIRALVAYSGKFVARLVDSIDVGVSLRKLSLECISFPCHDREILLQLFKLIKRLRNTRSISAGSRSSYECSSLHQVDPEMLADLRSSLQ